jgi:hypothetical protein
VVEPYDATYDCTKMFLPRLARRTTPTSLPNTILKLTAGLTACCQHQ